MKQEEAAQQLQHNERHLEQISTQKKNFQNQLSEIESALEALSSSDTSYRLIGNIMVKQSVETISAEMKEKKETITVRIATLEKQEAKLKEKNKEYQEAIMNTK